MKQNDFSTTELIKKYRNSHDESYLNRLFARHLSLLSIICFAKLQNEELVQRCLKEIYKALKTEIKKHELKDVESWFLLQTRVQCRRMIRLYGEPSQLEVNMVYSQSLKSLYKAFNDYLPDQNNQERKELLLKGLNWLQKEQRSCLEYVHFDHMTLDQIAYINGTSTSEVAHNLSMAEHNLKCFLKRKNEKVAV